MKKLILLSLSLIAFAIPSAVHAQSSDLLVNPESNPLFNETNWVPGNSITKTIEVTNLSETDTYMFGIATFDEQDVDALATQLKLEIIDQYGTVLYGMPGTPKTLADLFAETEYSTTPGQGTEINLITLPPKDTQVIKIKVSFPEESGNEWQATETVFSFGLGYTGSIQGAETTADKVLGIIQEILGATGQNILLGLTVGGLLFTIGVVATLKRKK